MLKELKKKQKKKRISASGSSFKATAQFHCLRTRLPEANPDVTVQKFLCSFPRAHMAHLALTACAQPADAAVVGTG